MLLNGIAGHHSRNSARRGCIWHSWGLQLRQGDLHVSIEVKTMGVFQSYSMAAMLLSRLNGYLHDSK